MRSRETLLRLHRFRTEEKRRQVADMEFMIQDFMRKYEDLDAQVKFEESRNGVSDPAHFNYSLSAKATRGRRDNVMRSIAELRDQLAEAQDSPRRGRAGTAPRGDAGREGKRFRQPDADGGGGAGDALRGSRQLHTPADAPRLQDRGEMFLPAAMKVPG